MAFLGQPIPKEIQEQAGDVDSMKAGAMGLATNLGGAMLPGISGVVYPPSIRRTIPESTTSLASANRRMIYKELQKDVKDAISTDKKFGGLMKKLGFGKVDAALIDYRDKIQALTSMPDSIVSRMRRWDVPEKGSVGSWREMHRFQQPTKDIGGSINIVPGSLNQDATILHEGIHAAHGVTSKLYKAKDIDPDAAAIWKKMPQKTKDAIADISRLDEFHRKFFDNAGPVGRARYAEHYKQWPAEILANEGMQKVYGLSSKLGRRLTTDEYFQTLGPIASKLQDKITKFTTKFAKEDEEIKRLVEKMSKMK